MKKYIMVCTSAKSKVIGGGCCYDKGGEELLNEMQEFVEKEGLSPSIIVKRSACMSNCKSGISVRTLPDRKTYDRVNAESIPSLIDAVAEKATKV